MAKDVTANQHYVLQTYLDSFADKKHQCYVYDKPTRCLLLMKRHSVSNQLENVLNDIQNGRFAFNSISDITKEAYIRETQINRMVNPLTYELSDSIIHKLNLLCFENANRFVVSSTEAFMEHLKTEERLCQRLR